VPSGHDRAYTFEDALAAMDAVGISASVLYVSPNYRTEIVPDVFRYDNSYAEEAALAHPDRFASVNRFDPRDPELADLMAETLRRPGTIGTRCTLVSEVEWEWLAQGVYEPLFAAAERQGVPLMIWVAGRAAEAAPIARRHPELTLVIDHMGLRKFPHVDRDPWLQLPQLLELAPCPNVAVKLSAGPALSAEPYPFSDVWPNVHRIIDAFGVDRVMWGSDITRARGHHNLSEAVGWLRYSDELSAVEKERVLGGTLRSILRWPRPE
jgi:L-fuconolactonase